jgi:hypothetical protein
VNAAHISTIEHIPSDVDYFTTDELELLDASLNANTCPASDCGASETGDTLPEDDDCRPPQTGSYGLATAWFPNADDFFLLAGISTITPSFSAKALQYDALAGLQIAISYARPKTNTATESATDAGSLPPYTVEDQSSSAEMGRASTSGTAYDLPLGQAYLGNDSSNYLHPTEEHTEVARSSANRSVAGSEEGDDIFGLGGPHLGLDLVESAARMFSCHYCKLHQGANGFRQRNHLLQHIRNYHRIAKEGDVDTELLDPGMPNFPCRHCNLHQGMNGFRRRDHLLQHIRCYHRMEGQENIGLESSRNPMVCPYRVRNPYRFNIRDHSACALQTYPTLSLLKFVLQVYS